MIVGELLGLLAAPLGRRSRTRCRPARAPGRSRSLPRIGASVERGAPPPRSPRTARRAAGRRRRRRPSRRRRPTAIERRPRRQVVDEVGGAVDRVDEPGVRRSCPGRSVPSSPTIASSGRSGAEAARRSCASAARSNSVTMSVVVDFVRAELGGADRAGAPGEGDRRRPRAASVGAEPRSSSSGVGASARCMPGLLAIGDLAPLAHRPQHEDGDDRSCRRRATTAPIEQAEPLGDGAVAVALELDEA